VCAAALLLSLTALSSACRRRSAGEAGSAAPGGRAGDALFLAAAPVWIPEELEPELSAMGIRRFYVAAAALGRDGRITPLPPPPVRLPRPAVLAVMGEPLAAEVLATGGEALGTAWAQSLKPLIADARGWADVAGVLLHIDPAPEQVAALAEAVHALKAGLSVPVSVTLRGSEPPTAWKPLAGVADEALLFAFGRRPELGDRLVPEISDETVKGMPLPFRLLVAPGGYGRGGDGKSFTGRRIPDGELNALSEDRSLDFSFGQVLSDEAGSLYTFRVRPGVRLADSRLGPDGGGARFQLLPFSEAVRLLALASRWGASNLVGRAFLVEGVPRDGHLVGYAAIRDLLMGRPLDLKLQVDSRAGASGPGWAEFSVHVVNLSSVPSDLSRLNNWIQARVEGGVFSSVKVGNFDRFELLSSPAEGSRPVSFGSAVVARLFESLFTPGEVKETDAIRVSGAKPKVFLSWHITGPDGRIGDGPEIEAPLEAPGPEPRKTAPPRLGRRR